MVKKTTKIHVKCLHSKWRVLRETFTEETEA
jgi:hypothetical protein